MCLTVPNLFIGLTSGLPGDGKRGLFRLCVRVTGLLVFRWSVFGFPFKTGGLGAKFGLPWLITGLLGLLGTPLLLSMESNILKFALLFAFLCSVL